jgi:SAM-dependent methyltransferase
MDIRSSYDSAATAYAEHLFHELDQKPLDRHLLNRFAEIVVGRGIVADLGCGPGHVAKYLNDHGVSVSGIDLSSEMIRCATRLCPDIQFRVGDIRALDIRDGHFEGIVAFYSIVHFAPTELEGIFNEWRRILVRGGPLLIAFHVGDHSTHLDELFGRPVSLDFQFHQPSAVTSSLRAAGFTVSEIAEREPYPSVEYASQRCYLLAWAS